MLGMWPQSRVPSFEVAFAVRYCTAPHLTLTHNFLSTWLGGPRGRLDPVRPLAGRQRCSPHDQAEPAFELTTFCLEGWCFTNCATYL